MRVDFNPFFGKSERYRLHRSTEYSYHIDPPISTLSRRFVGGAGLGRTGFQNP
jgi:hypothetical protein